MLFMVYVSAIGVPVEERSIAWIVVAVPMMLVLYPHLVLRLLWSQREQIE